MYRLVYFSVDGTKPMLFSEWRSNELCNYVNGEKRISLKLGYRCRVQVRGL